MRWTHFLVETCVLTGNLRCLGDGGGSSSGDLDHEQRPGMTPENVIVTVPLEGLATIPRNWNMSARSVPAVSMLWFSNCTQVTPLPLTLGALMFTLPAEM